MADQEHRAGVVLQQFLQQLQRVDVEVVGRLVEHQHVGRQREQPRQQHAVALAARQRAHRAVGPLGREQEVVQVAHHMLALAVELDPLAARADGVGQRGVQVEPGAHLVEIGHLQLAALAHLAGRGLQFAQDQLEQRGLARAVGADQADLVAAQDGGVEVLDDQLRRRSFMPTSVSSATILPLGAPASISSRTWPSESRRACALAAQHLQPLDAGHAAGAAGLHALADPHLLLRQQLVGAGVGQRVGRQLLLLHALVGAEVAGVAAQDAAVELDDAGGHAVEEGAVVGDQHHAALEAAPAGPAASRWNPGRGGWSARRAAARRARPPGPGPGPRASSCRPTAGRSRGCRPGAAGPGWCRPAVPRSRRNWPD